MPQRGLLQPFPAGVVSALVGFTSAFVVVLSGLQSVGADPDQAASGLLAVSVTMGLACVLFATWTRIPITVAWSTPGAALLASPGALTKFRAAGVGTLLQGASRNLLPYATAEQNVVQARLAVGRRARGQLPSPRETLAEVGAGHLARHRVSGLSGGEQQRVALAVAIANGPGLLLADEPTSQLDPEGAGAALDALTAVNERRGTTLVVVTHDPAVGGRLGRTVTIRDGRVGAEGKRGEQFAVVGRDGSVQLPEATRRRWPVGTLLRADDDADVLVLRRDGGPASAQEAPK